MQRAIANARRRRTLPETSLSRTCGERTLHRPPGAMIQIPTNAAAVAPNPTAGTRTHQLFSSQMPTDPRRPERNRTMTPTQTNDFIANTAVEHGPPYALAFSAGPKSPATRAHRLAWIDWRASDPQTGVRIPLSPLIAASGGSAASSPLEGFGPAPARARRGPASAYVRVQPLLWGTWIQWVPMNGGRDESTAAGKCPLCEVRVALPRRRPATETVLQVLGRHFEIGCVAIRG